MAASTPNRELRLNPEFDHYDYPATVSIDAHPGYPGHTTEEQDAIVEVLRHELLAAEPKFKAELRDDANFQGDVDSVDYRKRLDTLTLLRFLRATKWNIPDAKTKYVDVCQTILLFFLHFPSSIRLFLVLGSLHIRTLWCGDVSTNIFLFSSQVSQL